MDLEKNGEIPLDPQAITRKLRERMQREGKSHIALEKTVPMIINHLSDVIIEGTDREGKKNIWHSLETASLEDIITEYDVLKDIILDDLRPHSSIEKNKVIETILYYMGLSAWEFSKQKNIHHQEVEKRLQEKIRAEERERAWFENVLDSLPVGILIIERTTGNILFGNKSAKGLAGGVYPIDMFPDGQDAFYATDAEGKRISRNDLPRFRVARGEKLCAYEMTAHLPNRPSVTSIIHSDVIPATDGHPERIVLVFQEIKERKKWEEANLAVVKNLQEERVIRESFVSSLTHDLRTPLSVARMHAEMLSRKVSNSLQGKCRNVIKHIDEVDRMIQDLLDANKLKAGEKIPIHPCELCLNDIVYEVVADFTDLYGKRFHITGPEDICGFWCGKAMRRILDNLLSNAVKYGDSNRDIDIYIAQDNQFTRLSVHNFGPPIPKSDQAKMFEPFMRANVKDRKLEGWGIGLSLVKGLVEAHSGTISVKSDKETGTTFEMVFPNRIPWTH